MPAEKPQRFSSLRVVREVEPTQAVTDFCIKVAEISFQEFGEARAVHVKDRPRRELELQPGYETPDMRVATSSANVYDKNNLQVVLFERRAPTEMGLGRSFEVAKSWIRRSTTGTAPISRRVNTATTAELTDYERLFDAALAHGINNPDHIDVQCVSITPIINPDYAGQGREYGLVFANGPESSYLHDEADIISGALRKARHHRKIIYPTQRTHLDLGVMRIPAVAPDEQVDNFIDRVQDECLPLKVTLGPLLTYDK